MLARPRTLPVGFIQPCLPIEAPKPPTGAAWLHEIKHDGYGLMARPSRYDPENCGLLGTSG
jgi:ATP-dependent DNA ligase